MTPALRDRLARLGLVGRCVLLALILAAALAVALPIAISSHGTQGAWAALVAALVVWLALAVAAILGDLLSSRGDALSGTLLAMLVRMSLPLAACMIVYLVGGPLAAGGFVYFVLAFYLLALPVDTALAVLRVDRKLTS